MARTDRRRAPRMTVSDLAYVNLDPDNGGTILNISEGGLCFQARGPIRKTEIIRFWYSYRRKRVQNGGAGNLEVQATGISRFIEVHSELAWTDETQKKGGLRFVNLSALAREQIREWICQPELITVKAVASTVANRTPFLVAMRPSPNAIPEALDKLKRMLVRIRTTRLWRGFSGGLLVGALVSGLATSIIYFANHGQALGDSLIRMGERLGGKSELVVERRASAKYPSVGAPLTSAAMPELMKAWDEAAEPEPKPPEPVRERPKQNAPVSPSGTASAGERATTMPAYDLLRFPAKASSTASPELSSPVDRSWIPANLISPAVNLSAGMLPARAPEIEPGWTSAVHVESLKGAAGVGMASEKYLEIGRFKERLLADEKTQQLKSLRFPATMFTRSRFLGKSYQVLVGPYREDREAEAVHRDLASHGFTPRSYERGKRDFTLPHALTANGKLLPAGYCVISWESYMPDAIVRIADDRSMGVTLDAKWELQSMQYEQNAVAYRVNRDGSRTLVEIRFSGMHQALVFGAK